MRRSARVLSERAREKKGSHLEERLRPTRSGDGKSVEEMARRVDSAIATQRLVAVQGCASGSVELRCAASRSGASPLTARRAARLTERRTAQPAVRQSARASAGSLLLQARRANSNARSGCGLGKAMGGADVELRGRQTLM